MRDIVAAALLVICQSAFAQACYESTIMSPTPFMGNHGEIFKLADGSLWEVQYEYEYMYEYYPTVVICPTRGKVVVGGKSLSVSNVSGGYTPRQARPSTTKDSFDSAKVDNAHPGWGVVVRSKEFTSWLSVQPDSVRKLSVSPTADQVILLLDLYKRDSRASK
jgi:hypothetical protein